MERNWSVAPGEYLEEWAQDNGVKQGELAERLGVSRKHVNEVINGRAGISPDMAARLEMVTGIPTDAWLRYQAQYDADEARARQAESLRGFGASLSAKTGSYLRKMGLTTATARNPEELGHDFLSLLRCADANAYKSLRDKYLGQGLAALALKENKEPLDEELFMAWLAVGDRKVSEFPIEVEGFSPKRLKEAMPLLKSRAEITDENTLADLRSILARAGVYLVLAPCPKGLPVYGATRWAGDNPVVCLTGRRPKDGYVIWSLFHELGHIANDGKGMTLDVKAGSREAREKPANDFARRWLFGEHGEEAFRLVRTRAELVSLAHEIGVCPGVAVRSMHQRRWADYSMFNDLMKDISFAGL